MWACLTCGLCKEACRVDVDLPEFFRRVRGIARDGGGAEVPTHGGLVHTFERLCSQPALAPRINAWAEAPGLRFDPASDTAFVAGAAAVLPEIVNDVPYDAAAVPRAALGVQPRLVEGERPSGHDLFYSGDDVAFARLARLNVDAMRATRARRAVFACPETMHAYRDLYPRVLGEALGVECVHLVQPLAEAVRAGKVAFRPPSGEPAAVAYHDSCRMGRSLGLYDEPRLVLGAAGAHLVELADNRAYAVCCGVGAWQRCDPVSRQIRLGRMAEAREAGASILISPCSRCTLHFQCQACHDGTGIVNSGETKIMDLAVYVADRIAHRKVG
jgi:Fe-S oxidoreductase